MMLNFRGPLDMSNTTLLNVNPDFKNITTIMKNKYTSKIFWQVNIHLLCRYSNQISNPIVYGVKCMPNIQIFFLPPPQPNKRIRQLKKSHLCIVLQAAGCKLSKPFSQFKVKEKAALLTCNSDITNIGYNQMFYKFPGTSLYRESTVSHYINHCLTLTSHHS